MEEIYVNVGYDKCLDSKPSQTQTSPRCSERRFHGAVVLCLGLLCVFLMAGLIGLGVHYRESVRDSSAKLSTVKANLTERLQSINNEMSSVTEERDRLNASLSEITEELDKLQSLSKQNHDSAQRSAAELSSIKVNLTELLQARGNKLSSLTKERDLLNASLIKRTEELEKLQKKTCPAGWKMFSHNCYFLSDKSGSWDKGREDCKGKGADLLVINTPEEQKFVLEFSKKTIWIGLNDRDQEGVWKWIDGTPFTLKYWAINQPDNGDGDPIWGEEDCVQINADHNLWNDLSCQTSLQWICEKIA